MSYRFDNRTEDEFKRDIEECSKFETILMTMYVSWLNSRPLDRKYTFRHTGVDNEGKYIANDKEISAKADFLLVCDDGTEHRIEIKHCKPERNRFHLKVPHVERCVTDDVCIVNFMATDTPERRFCILTPQLLSKSLVENIRVMMWSKDCIRYNNSDYTWISV